MTIYRKWYCTCRGEPIELTVVDPAEEEPGEATCQRCGASQSSDPGKTIVYKDVENWDD